MLKQTSSLAIASVPVQEWDRVYTPEKSLCEGTIFPNLNLPFYKADDGGSCMTETDPAARDLFQISCIGFMINDLTLYLDTHPDCPKGQSLYRKLLQERLNQLSEFAHSHYPLTQSSIVTGNCAEQKYCWDEGPAPWEGGNI